MKKRKNKRIPTTSTTILTAAATSIIMTYPKHERTDRKYPVKSNLTRRSCKNYLRACSSTYVKSVYQEGISSPQIKVPSSRRLGPKKRPMKKPHKNVMQTTPDYPSCARRISDTILEEHKEPRDSAQVRHQGKTGPANIHG